jgi:sugar phosphate isomerase/epimerase
MMWRCFAVTALALLATALPVLSVEESKAKRDDSASENLGMKLSLQCWTFNRLSFSETVDKAVELGVKYLEIYPGQKVEPGSKETVNRTMSAETMAKMKKKLADAGGLKVIAYGVDGVPTDEEGARKTFEWAKKMGIRVLVTETTPNDIHEKLCKEFNIRYALHNHPQSWPPAKVLEACKGRGKLMGSCSDTGHWMRASFIPVETLKKMKGRVEHLHFKDLNQLGKGRDVHDVPWGTGKGDVKGMLTELKRQGYKGYLSIEYEYGSLEHLDQNLPKCVAFFDKALAELANE